jgi:Fic family protein
MQHFSRRSGLYGPTFFKEATFANGGGTRPGYAVFVPAPPDHVPALLADLESFIHQTDTPDTLPPLLSN